MTAALILGAVIACCLAAMAWLVATAREGFEDAAGFHFEPRGADPAAGLSRRGQPSSPVASPAAFSTSAHASGDSRG
jgi:hypothetical protein